MPIRSAAPGGSATSRRTSCGPGGATVVALGPDERLPSSTRTGARSPSSPCSRPKALTTRPRSARERTRPRRCSASSCATETGSCSGSPRRARPRGSTRRPPLRDDVPARSRRSRSAPSVRSRSSWPRRRAGSSTARRHPPTCSSRSGGAAPQELRAARAPGAARRAAARLPRRQGDRARVRGSRRRVHPGDRRRGEAVLRLPRVPPGTAGGRRRSAASMRP